jgi:exopolysaccharide biosynthesis polyprenyl glycosylphosphotransferase
MALRTLGTAVTKQQLLLAAGDVVCIALALFLSNLVYIGYQLGYGLYSHLVLTAVPSLFIITIHMVFFYFTDVYDLKQDLLSMRHFAAVVLAIGLSLVFLGLCFFMFPGLRYGRAVMFIHVLFLLAFVMAWRHIFVKLARIMRGGKTLLIVGMEKCTSDIAKECLAPGQQSYRLIGYVPANGNSDGEAVERVPRLGSPEEIEHVVQAHKVQEIVLSPSAEKNGALVRALIRLGYNGVVVIDAVSFYERLTGRIPFDHLTDIWLLSQTLGNVRFFQWRVKRVMDILFAVVGLVLGAIPLALAMIAIKLTSPGPVFYRQERLGRNGERFTLIKLRTMIPDAEQHTGAVYATDDDPRITPIGRFFRKSRLDEIPQLWNVLRGDMSLVGPRPERPEFVAQFEKTIPYYTERLAVRPGITGWAQVSYPYAATLDETKQKLQYDLYYIKNMSGLFDCLILVMTLKTMLFAKGR